MRLETLLDVASRSLWINQVCHFGGNASDMLTKVSYKAVGISSADRRDNLIAIIIIGRRRTAKTRPENEETTNHSWTASPKSRCRSLVFPRKQGGRDLMQLEAAHAVEITKLVEYVERKEDPLKQIVRTHQHNTDSAVFTWHNFCMPANRCCKTAPHNNKKTEKNSFSQNFILEDFHQDSLTSPSFD